MINGAMANPDSSPLSRRTSRPFLSVFWCKGQPSPWNRGKKKQEKDESDGHLHPKVDLEGSHFFGLYTQFAIDQFDFHCANDVTELVVALHKLKARHCRLARESWIRRLRHQALVWFLEFGPLVPS